MSVPPGMGGGAWGKDNRDVCQEDTGQKEVAGESPRAAVVSGHRLHHGEPQGFRAPALIQESERSQGLRLRI